MSCFLRFGVCVCTDTDGDNDGLFKEVLNLSWNALIPALRSASLATSVHLLEDLLMAFRSLCSSVLSVQTASPG